MPPEESFTPIQKVFIVEDMDAITSMYKELAQWIEDALAKAPENLKVVYFEEEFPLKDKKLLSLLVNLKQEKNYKLLGEVSIEFVKFVEQWISYVWKDNRHIFTMFDTIYRTQKSYIEKYTEQAKKWKSEQDKLFSQFANPKLDALREQMGIAPQRQISVVASTQEKFDNLVNQVFPKKDSQEEPPQHQVDTAGDKEAFKTMIQDKVTEAQHQGKNIGSIKAILSRYYGTEEWQKEIINQIFEAIPKASGK